MLFSDSAILCKLSNIYIYICILFQKPRLCEIHTFISDGKSEVKRLLVRPKHTWKNNIKTNHKETVYGYVNWIRYSGRLL